VAGLERFIDAQKGVWEDALSELEGGRKQTHWMWFIFPQLAGLGSSATARYYGVRGTQEAADYLRHHILGETAHLTRRRRSKEVPPQGISAIFIDYRPWLHHVPFGLAHLLTLSIKDVPQADDILEAGAIKK